MISRKYKTSNYIEVSKKQKRFGKFVRYKNSYKGKIHLNVFPNIYKKIGLGQLEKQEQVYIGKKREENILGK